LELTGVPDGCVTRTAWTRCRDRAVRAALLFAASAIVLTGMASCGGATRVADEWPVLNGVPRVTYTVDGETRTFTGGYCRGTTDGSKIIVVSGDQRWVAAPRARGEGIELRAESPFDVDGFWVDVKLGDRTYHSSYEQVESLEERYTALALSPDQNSGTFLGRAFSTQDEKLIWYTLSGSFVCASGDATPSEMPTPPPTPEPSASPVHAPAAQTITMSDFYFADVDGNKEPTFDVPAGQSLTFNIISDGFAFHNVHVANADGQYAMDFCTTVVGDPCSDPPMVRPGTTARIAVKFDAPGTYEFRCDFHPADMRGTFIAR
jgi:plastocyanin